MTALAHMKAAVAAGVSLACASCNRYWEGVERGADRCTAEAPCAGPFGGGSFPLYEGPITDFSQWCLRCGSVSVEAIRVPGSSRAFGLCEAHRADLPVSSEGSPGLLEVIRPGLLLPPPRPRPKGDQTLGRLLAEVSATLVQPDPEVGK